MKKNGVFLIQGFLGGCSIALGGTIFLRVRDSFPGANVVAAFLFALGLLTICTRGYSLYTGKVCYVFENKASYLLEVALVWVGNFAGCVGVALLEMLTPLGSPNSIAGAAQQLVESKTAASYLGFFVLGILCNIFIFLAANGYAKNPHEIGKYIMLFLAVAAFIIAGTEHSVANMYFWAISGELFQNPGLSLLYILIATAGNAVGGVIFPLLEQARRKLEPAT